MKKKQIKLLARKVATEASGAPAPTKAPTIKTTKPFTKGEIKALKLDKQRYDSDVARVQKRGQKRGQDLLNEILGGMIEREPFLATVNAQLVIGKSGVPEGVTYDEPEKAPALPDPAANPPADAKSEAAKSEAAPGAST